MPVEVYFRKSDHFDEPEFLACSDVFRTVENRAKLTPGSLVIPRYTMLPFAKELEADMKSMGCTLINSVRQHRYVADMANWYPDLAYLTPKTYFSLYEAFKASNGPFVLKGETNSKKFSWRTHMYAADKAAAGEVYSRLQEDGVIGTQQIVVRDYVPLQNYGVMPSGVPISHEFRCFFYKKQLLSKAYYWSNEEVEPVDNVPGDFLDAVAAIVAPNTNFWVADVAKTVQGHWIVVELNDGCMSGLSRNDPTTLYNQLKKAIE